jgi:hypothetical protein
MATNEKLRHGLKGLPFFLLGGWQGFFFFQFAFGVESQLSMQAFLPLKK